MRLSKGKVGSHEFWSLMHQRKWIVFKKLYFLVEILNFTALSPTAASSDPPVIYLKKMVKRHRY